MKIHCTLFTRIPAKYTLAKNVSPPVMQDFSALVKKIETPPISWKTDHLVSFSKPLHYEEPPLPDANILIKNFSEIFNRQLTGEGITQYKKLEDSVKNLLKVENVCVFNNATSALTTLVKALELKGEVLISPLGHPSNVNTFAWNGVKPVFVDIDPKTFQIDVHKLESAISDKTSAIVLNLSFGNPPDIDKINSIAKKHGLKVILDAENVFGVEKNGVNITKFVDAATFKIQPNIEYVAGAGGVVFKDSKLKNTLESLKHYGILDIKGFNNTNTTNLGINGKLTEVDAAWIHANLHQIDDVIRKRQLLADSYRIFLKNVSGIQPIDTKLDHTENLHVFPVLVNTKEFGMSVPEMMSRFKKYNVHLKQYINPLLNPLISNNEVYKTVPSAWHENLPHAHAVLENTLLLPLNYKSMAVEDVMKISNILKSFKNAE